MPPQPKAAPGRHRKPGAGSQTFTQQRAVARSQARTKARATLATRTAGVTPEGAAVYAAGKAGGAAKKAGAAAGQARIIPGNRQYQGVILAEYLVAILLVVMSPIATGGSPAAKAKNSPSPYEVGDLKQLVAVSAVFFILALLSSGDRGRLAAWLGGLILIAVGMSKAGQAQLSAVFGVAEGQPEGEAPGTPAV
jgi:hypothetical protein